jgi:hypothetical protein
MPLDGADARPHQQGQAMKHATAASLDGIEALLRQIREQGALKEKSRGVFYCGGRATLHFHEDVAGMFADLRLGDGWERFAANTPAERAALLRRIHAGFPRARE